MNPKKKKKPKQKQLKAYLLRTTATIELHQHEEKWNPIVSMLFLPGFKIYLIPRWLSIYGERQQQQH